MHNFIQLKVASSKFKVAFLSTFFFLLSTQVTGGNA